MAKKQSSSKVSTLASKVLSGAKKPTAPETSALAASVLSQNEKKGKPLRGLQILTPANIFHGIGAKLPPPPP